MQKWLNINGGVGAKTVPVMENKKHLSSLKPSVLKFFSNMVAENGATTGNLSPEQMDGVPEFAKPYDLDGVLRERFGRKSKSSVA